MNGVPCTLQALELALDELAWEERRSGDERMVLWVPTQAARLKSGVEYEDAGVFLPQNPQAPDFARILHRAIGELAELSAANILETLETSRLRIERTLDKFTVATDGAAVRSGIIDWTIGARLVKGLSQVLHSGARVADEPKRRYGNSSRIIANNYVDACLMGQTEIGSYVVNAFVPAHTIISASDSVQVKKQSTIESRKISETVFVSVQATKEALDDYVRHDNPEAFDWAVPHGVSVEMLKGFDSLINHDDTEIAVEFLATDNQSVKEKPYRRSVVLEPTMKEAVRVGIDTLSRAPVPTNLTISGEVVGLKREWDEPDSCQIRVKALQEGKTRIFTASLSEEDYDKALEAHKKQVFLGVDGLVEKSRFQKVHGVFVTNAPVGGEKSVEHGDTEQLDLLDEVEC